VVGSPPFKISSKSTSDALDDEGKNMENEVVDTFPTASSTRFCIFTAWNGVFFLVVVFSAGDSADRFLLGTVPTGRIFM
jgi:hypothetical protein